MYQGASDHMLGAREDVAVADEAFGVDFEAEVAVVTGDVPMGTMAGEAGRHIRLLMLANDVSLRNLIPAELAKGFGFLQSKPASSFSPVAVTPDELGDAWRDAKVHLPLISTLNGKVFGRPNAGVDMTFSFAQLIAHVAKTRDLVAGSIVGSGTVSNQEAGGPGRPAAVGGVGYSCIAEQRRGDAQCRQADDAVPRDRRPDPHRDARRSRALDLRRDRAEGRAGLTALPFVLVFPPLVLDASAAAPWAAPQRSGGGYPFRRCLSAPGAAGPHFVVSPVERPGAAWPECACRYPARP